MAEFDMEHLQFLKNREDMDAQWERSWVVFDKFYTYLREKEFTPEVISFKMNSVILFVMNYLFSKTSKQNMIDVNCRTISEDMKYLYDEMFPEMPQSKYKEFGRAVMDFYEFLEKEGYFPRRLLDEIRDVGYKEGFFQETD